MNQQDRDKIEKIIHDRRRAHEKLTRAGSGVYQAFLEMEKAAYSDGTLSKMHKEPICFEGPGVLRPVESRHVIIINMARNRYR